LPSNVAIAVNLNEQYVLLKKSKYIVAEKRLKDFKDTLHLSDEVLERLPGSLLVGAQANHPWISNRKAQIIGGDFVAMDTGTGLVHIAPGHGAEDYALGQQQNPPLPVLSPVNDRGLFTDEVPEWKGQHVFKANPLIIEFLKQSGRLIHSEEISHSYPHCWRCHKPVIFRATEQWFLKMDHEQLRERLLKVIQGVNWIPGYGQNRITGMVESRPDWCLSRQRLWGTEIPSSSSPADSGRGSMDSPPTTGGNDVKKDPDIFDVWFESGVSWAAVLEKRNELGYPSDMYLEGSDQHRGWFQTSLIPSVALKDRAPYKAVLTHGFVMDGEGRPMSKSLGNVISPDQIIQQYGADVLRLWVGSSDYGRDVRLSPEILKGLSETYRKVRNTLRYLLGNLAGFNPKTDLVAVKALHKDIDRWAMQTLQTKIKEARKAFDQYEFHRATALLVDFCIRDLSGIYLDMIKDRLYCDAANSSSRRSAQTVLYHLAASLIRLFAPILPFTANEAWQELGGEGHVAYQDLPVPEGQVIDDGLGTDWQYLWDLREEVNQAIEVKRKAGEVGSSLEAWVTLGSRAPDFLRILEKVKADLPTLFMVAKVDIEAGATHQVAVRHAKEAGSKKCARCWTWRGDVGSSGRWADVCARCADVLEKLPEQGKVSA
jgi:isoleucyl-tRNA synthetase